MHYKEASCTAGRFKKFLDIICQVNRLVKILADQLHCSCLCTVTTANKKNDAISRTSQVNVSTHIFAAISLFIAKILPKRVFECNPVILKVSEL